MLRCEQLAGIAGQADEKATKHVLVVLLEVVDVARAPEEPVAALLLDGLHRRERLTPDQQVDRVRVELAGQLIIAELLVELADLQHQADVARIRQQQPLERLERFASIARSLEEPGDLSLEDHGIRQVASESERARRVAHVALGKERLAKIEIHLRRHDLCKADETPTVRQLAVVAHRRDAPAERVTRSARKLHQLAQHRRPAPSRYRQRILERDHLPVAVIDLLREVSEELIEVVAILVAW